MDGGGTGDAIHFLKRLSRANEPQRDLALALYWEPGRVRYVLARASLPPGDGRVALSINERDQGPFVVVERSGRFVTCLGEGMRHELPTIEHARLRALIGKAETQAARVRAARELCGDRRLGSVFGVLRRRGERVSSEEFVAACALQPVLKHEILRDAIGQFSGAEALRARLAAGKGVRKRDEPLLRRYWEQLWYTAALHPLAAVGGARGLEGFIDLFEREAADASPSWAMVRQDNKGHAIRGMFLVARLGKRLLPGYKRRYRCSSSPYTFGDSLMGLVTLAVRHPRLRKEVVKSLLRVHEFGPDARAFLAPIAEGVFRDALRVIETPDEVYEKYGRLLQENFVRFGETVDLPAAYRYDRPEACPSISPTRPRRACRRRSSTRASTWARCSGTRPGSRASRARSCSCPASSCAPCRSPTAGSAPSR